MECMYRIDINRYGIIILCRDLDVISELVEFCNPTPAVHPSILFIMLILLLLLLHTEQPHVGH